MSCATSLGAPVFVTTYLLFVMGCVAQKVYFDCGAKVDVVDVQGLILSPGFPYNYSSGTHCVWQFFVPVDYQLILEMFDFDVFESHNAAAQYASTFNSEEEEEELDEEVTFPPGSFLTDKTLVGGNLLRLNGGDAAKTRQSSQRGEDKQIVVQEESSKMEVAKVSNSAKRSADASSGLDSPPPSSLLVLPGAAAPEDKALNSASSFHLRELSPSSYPTLLEETTIASPEPTDIPAASPETQHPVLDACPHDVLYISDLITFSSRFCGSNRPPSSQLVFGSSQEMVEVIMELITTTHWGRGFALLFHYHNLTEPGGSRHVSAPTAGKVDSLLAAVSGAAFFAMVLTSALCIIFRPKLCPKRASSCSSSNSEVPEGVQNTGAEVSELQLMAENQINMEATTEAAGDSPPQTVTADNSENAEVDLSCSGLTELDLGADEVFIVSSAPCSSRLPVSPHTQRDRFLRHSDTGPSQAGDWPSPDPSTSPSGSRTGKDGACARPRAWSVRTFQDFLPPLPQLHKKWCSWNSTSPFTKLVDSAPPSLVGEGREGRKIFSDAHLEANADRSTISDSSISNASYPLTQSAQRQRRLNSISNLRRSRFTGPCFGLLSGAADPVKTPSVAHAESSSPEPGPASPASAQCQAESGQAGKRREFPGEGDHVSVPVFAISEEEDRQPLVPSEHLGRIAASAVLNGSVRGAYEGKKPAAGNNSLHPSNQRARPEWRPWGSQASGGVVLLSPTESIVAGDGEPSLRRATVLCSVTNRM